MKAELKNKESGKAGHIKDYDVFISGDKVKITNQDEDAKDFVAEEKVQEPSLSEFIEEAGELRLGWAKMPDFEVIYIYDPTDDNFGYAVNLSSSMMSEWGYAPF